jgi:hypothetical protein
MAVAATLVVASATAGADAEPGCKVESTRVVAFSSTVRKDTIRVSVIGKTCEAGTFSVELRRADGALIYQFHTPLAAFYPTGDPLEEQSPEALLEQAKQLVSSQLPASPLSTTAELPVYQPGHFELDEMSDGAVLVEQTRYERLRAAVRPAFYHSTAHEVGRYVVYDPESKSGVAVLESWL